MQKTRHDWREVDPAGVVQEIKTWPRHLIVYA